MPTACKTTSSNDNRRAPAHAGALLDSIGGDRGTRTPDLCIANAALSQLSYIPKMGQYISPQHGRSVVCTPSALAPWEGGPFTVARYASFQLRDVQPQQGWQVWACDLQGVPLALAHVASRRVCLLFRPDSLLSEPQAQHALRAAIAFAAVEKASL